MKNQVLIPTVAKFPGDIETSWKLAKSASGYEPGLMLVIQGGLKGVTENAEKQKSNLTYLKDEYGDMPIVVMLSNMPIEEMDFYHNTSVALTHIKAGVDFTKNLPLGGRRMVTFHLNTLLTPEEFSKLDFPKTLQIFNNQITPALAEAATYAQQSGVELKLETIPDPEFGDLPADHEGKYLGLKLRDLRDPFPIFSEALICNFGRLREIGLGICIDICHSRTLNVNLLEEVKGLVPTDLVHLNDGSGEFTPSGGVFKEGVALGEGDITVLPEIIGVLNKKKIPIVLEINENDFINRPNTRMSIKYLLENS